MKCHRCRSDDVELLFAEDRYDKDESKAAITDGTADELEKACTWEYWRCNRCGLIIIQDEEFEEAEEQ